MALPQVVDEVRPMLEKLGLSVAILDACARWAEGNAAPSPAGLLLCQEMASKDNRFRSDLNDLCMELVSCTGVGRQDTHLTLSKVGEARY